MAIWWPCSWPLRRRKPVNSHCLTRYLGCRLFPDESRKQCAILKNFDSKYIILKTGANIDSARNLVPLLIGVSDYLVSGNLIGKYSVEIGEGSKSHRVTGIEGRATDMRY